MTSNKGGKTRAEIPQGGSGYQLVEHNTTLYPWVGGCFFSKTSWYPGYKLVIHVWWAGGDSCLSSYIRVQSGKSGVHIHTMLPIFLFPSQKLRCQRAILNLTLKENSLIWVPTHEFEVTATNKSLTKSHRRGISLSFQAN